MRNLLHYLSPHRCRIPAATLLMAVSAVCELLLPNLMSQVLDEGLYDHPFKERGIFIDIFPLDRLWPFIHRMTFQSYAFTLIRKDKSCSEKTMRKIRLLTWVNRHFTFPVLRAFCKITGGNKPLMLDLGIPFHLEYNINDVFPLGRCQFENTSFPVPANCSNMLTDMYGDYMKLPDDLDHVYHHVEKLEFFD